MTTKDKVIAKLKNQNVELTAKIMKIKGEHDHDLLKANTKSDVLKKEIIKLKAQVNLEANKKIVDLEAKVVLAKTAYDNVNNDNVVMHQVIKDLQTYLLEQMVEKLMSLNSLQQLIIYAILGQFVQVALNDKLVPICTYFLYIYQTI